MQNIGVCLLVVQSAIKPPDSDLAFIVPLTIQITTAVPANIITVIYLLRQKWIQRVS